MSDTVNELLTKTLLGQLPYEDTLQIVKKGRPQASGLELNCEHNEKNRVYKCFSEANNKKILFVNVVLYLVIQVLLINCVMGVCFCSDVSPSNKARFNNLNHPSYRSIQYITDIQFSKSRCV